MATHSAPSRSRRICGGFKCCDKTVEAPSRIAQQQTLSVAYDWQSETRIVRALQATVANASSPELRMTAVGPTSTSESPYRNPPRNFLQRLHRSGRRSHQKCALLRGSGPHGAIAVLKQRKDPAAVQLGVGGELSIFPTGKPVGCADQNVPSRVTSSVGMLLLGSWPLGGIKGQPERHQSAASRIRCRARDSHRASVR